MKVENLLTLAGTARQIDVPTTALRESVISGRIKPDAQSRAGRKLYVFFKPSRLEQIKLAMTSKPQLMAN
jgi:hypothetical protein